MLANVGRKFNISLKSAVSAVLKESSKILNKNHIYQKEFLKGG
jgi:hypothetical protein